MSSDDSNNPPMIDHPVIDDRVIVGLPTFKATKKTGKGRHSWPILELVTAEKDKKGNKKFAYTYPALEDVDNWKDKMLISVLGEKAHFMQEFGQVCDAWKDMVQFLRHQRVNGDELIYEKGISVDTVKGRWKEILLLTAMVG
jgi:hypothetical protein